VRFTIVGFLAAHYGQQILQFFSKYSKPTRYTLIAPAIVGVLASLLATCASGGVGQGAGTQRSRVQRRGAGKPGEAVLTWRGPPGSDRIVPRGCDRLMSLTKQQALEMYQSDDLIGIGMEADALRRKLHPEGVVTYIIDRNINYTNFCTEYCTFCAFYRPLKGPRAKEGYILDFETIYEKIRETVELGGTGVLMQGGLDPDLKIDWHEQLLRGIKQRFPKIHLHCYSASEIIAVAEYSGLTIRDTILRLRDAGLDSIPGGGAEILDDEVRYKIARLKCLTDDWLNVHRTAHQIGMRTTATMMFGVGEKHEHRINHFQRLYELQEETGGFTAFIPWTFQPAHTALGGRHWEEATAVEYLKNLAISRLYLSNFKNVQSSWVTQGLKVCQLGLRFGGNDVGSVMLEENVVRAAGVSNCTTEEELRRIIRDAGFRPAQRDTLYRTYFLN